jgi:hypothetical protein
MISKASSVAYSLTAKVVTMASMRVLGKRNFRVTYCLILIARNQWVKGSRQIKLIDLQGALNSRQAFQAEVSILSMEERLNGEHLANES